MLIKHLKDCSEFTSGDGTRLRELLHPDKEDVKLRYSLAQAILNKGAVSSPHILRTSEVYYITEGRGRMHIDNESAEVGPGDMVYIPPAATQYIENIGQAELVFFCIVDPAWRAEDEEITG